jgi:hypothetical protein
MAAARRSSEVRLDPHPSARRGKRGVSRQPRQHPPHLHRLPLADPARGPDAASIERRRKGLQGRCPRPRVCRRWLGQGQAAPASARAWTALQRAGSGMPVAARLHRRFGRRCRVVIWAFVTVPANAGQRRHALLLALEIAGGGTDHPASEEPGAPWIARRRLGGYRLDFV